MCIYYFLAMVEPLEGSDNIQPQGHNSHEGATLRTRRKENRMIKEGKSSHQSTVLFNSDRRLNPSAFQPIPVVWKRIGLSKRGNVANNPPYYSVVTGG